MDKFTIQLAYTTNNPFTYEIYAAKELTEAELNAELEQLKNQENQENQDEENEDADNTSETAPIPIDYVEYKLQNKPEFGMPALNGTEYHLNTTETNQKSYVQIHSAAYYNTYDYNLKTAGNYVKLTVKLAKKENYSEALEIPTYLDDFEILDKNGNPIEATQDNDITVVKDSETHIYTYIIPKASLQTLSADVYYIPVNFKARSGKEFEKDNLQYSNYEVLLTVGLLKTNSLTEAPLTNSESFDHIIYTNARIYSDVIE